MEEGLTQTLAKLTSVLQLKVTSPLLLSTHRRSLLYRQTHCTDGSLLRSTIWMNGHWVSRQPSTANALQSKVLKGGVATKVQHQYKVQEVEVFPRAGQCQQVGRHGSVLSSMLVVWVRGWDGALRWVQVWTWKWPAFCPSLLEVWVWGQDGTRHLTHAL